MNQKKKPLYWRLLLPAVVFLCALCACGGGGGGGIPEPVPEPEPEPEVTTGTVSFAPDWGGMIAPSSLRYHFYPAAGSVVTKDADGNAFSVTLENGAYRMLAYNTDATGVTFVNTGSYATAVVSVAPAEVPTRAATVIGRPENLYAFTMDNLVVEKGVTVSQTPAVRNLVKPLALRFTIDDGSVISSIEGYLNGFYPLVLLSTGKPDEAALTACAETGLLFGVAVSGDAGSADLRCLGMADPKGEPAYQCMLVLNITVTDGRSTETEVDLSEVLSKILAENSGTLPDGTPAEIGIKLEMLSGSVMGFKGTVSDWKNGGVSDGDL